MSNWFGIGFGLLALSAVFVLSVGLFASLPVVAFRALLVVSRRDWLPISYSVRSLLRRKMATLSTFAVFALVVFVLTAVMMVADGITHTLAATGTPLNVKLVNRSSVSEWTSWVDRDVLPALGALPGVATNEQGQPLISGESVALVWAQQAHSADPDDGANLTVRGVHPIAFQLHPTTIARGRSFAPGTREIILGKALVGRFEGAELGNQMSFADSEWTVVGIADHGGTALDSEVWGDIDVVQAITRRGYSTVTLALVDRDSFDELEAALASDPRKSVLRARREVEYWKSLSGQSVEFVTVLGVVIGVILALGAISGAVNTMYAQVAARTRELGTLRAVGFKPRAILVTVVLEGVILSLAAGAVGVLGATLLQSSTFELTTVQTMSEITYGFHLSLHLAVSVLAVAALMGYAGSLLPALRAARMPIADAVRSD